MRATLVLTWNGSELAVLPREALACNDLKYMCSLFFQLALERSFPLV